MAKIEGLLRLIRPINCIVMSFAVLVGTSLTGLGNLQWINLLFGAITAFTLTGAARTVNDYYDYGIDKINEPNRPIPSARNILLFASMAFLSNTGREITKGIVDIEGDRQHRIKTLAVVFGSKKAALAAAIFFILAVCLSPIPLIIDIVSIWFIPFVLVTDVGLFWCSISLLKNPERENSRKIKKTVLFLFIFGLLSFIFGMLG
jgi:4-hydroxybenzoate polyprenyltransferase